MYYKLKTPFFTVLIACSLPRLMAQTVQVINSGTKTSLRGLSVVNDRVIWVSGNNGTIGRSVDSGHTFKWVTVKGFGKTDFRDIEAFDESTAVIMGIAEPAYILRTVDGGDTWKKVYENNEKGIFLDAMEFRRDGSGIVVGDPIQGKFFMARTPDAGINWENIPPAYCPAADSGEGCFASSGTNIRLPDQREWIFISGGLSSNLIIGTKKITLPILQGKESTGANSIAIKNRLTMVIAGGDFSARDSMTKNCIVTLDGGKNWIAPPVPPHGYRSCVEWLGKKNWISCGLNGVDYSKDEGMNWDWISKESFHVCRKAKTGKSVFLAGNDGRIGKISLQ